ncbi:unnamed protein product [Thelazia callipaeda]|uniref:ARM repeat superfamily protein n=1 Tax=Thelazia callipaeda TaxID=103827 RepID=A0A0N5CT47_THECL|nr:unnamed protein product [Thelazia callipaeda]
MIRLNDGVTLFYVEYFVLNICKVFVKFFEIYCLSKSNYLVCGFLIFYFKFDIYDVILLSEMIHLFEKADYGMQYRALSHTGAVLGSMSETGIPSYEPVLSKDDKIGTNRDE